MFWFSPYSFVTFIYSCICSIIGGALQHPIGVFLLSFVIGVTFVINFHAIKLLCEIGTAPTTATENNFDYGVERGPQTWLCPADNQSPINIIRSQVKDLLIREHLVWNHYDDMPRRILLKNTGRTVVLRASYNGNAPTIGGADLLANYTFLELRFRWSQLDNEGSEHMLNYKKFPLEIQAMHHTGPTAEQISCYDLLMIAYFYELSGNNPYLEPLIEGLSRIQRPGSIIELNPFPLSYLCYPFHSGFYSYGGSLTEPPCFEGVEWFVFPQPLAISERQLSAFRSLLSSDGQSCIQRNARPVHALNASRLVNFNIHYRQNENAAKKRHPNRKFRTVDECHEIQ